MRALLIPYVVLLLFHSVHYLYIIMRLMLIINYFQIKILFVCWLLRDVQLLESC